MVNIGPKIGIEGEAEYRKQINNIIQSTKTLKSELNAVATETTQSANPFKRLSNEISTNAEKRRILTSAIEEQKAKLVDLKNMQEISAAKSGENSTQTLKWKQAVADQTAELNRMETELANIPGKLTTIGTAFQNVGSIMQSVGHTMTTYITLPLVGLGTASFNAYKSYESAFTGVQKTVDATAEEYEELSDWIMEASTRMASSKTDIAGVMEVAGQLGVSGVNDLETFTETMVMLGDTTNMSAEEAATALAQFTNITGESNDNVDKLGSAVVALGNNFATDEASVVMMSQRLASAGTIAGLSSTEILGLATAMSSVGIEAEAGGSSMSQALTQIGNAVAEGATESNTNLQLMAETAGTTAQEFADAWNADPATALTSFINGLNQIDESGGNVNAVLDELGMSGIRESNMLKSLALSSENLGSAMETANTAYETNNALQDEAAKRYETSEAKLSQAKEKMTNAAVELGGALAPSIIKIADAISSLAEKFASLSPEQQDMIVKMGLVVAAAGPLISVIGSIASAIGTVMTVAPMISSSVAGIGPALSGIGAALTGTVLPAIGSALAAAAPVIGVIAAIAAAIVGIILVVKNWGAITEWISEKWTAFKETISTIVDNIKTAISEKWEAIKTAITEKVEAIKTAITEKWNAIKTTVTNAVTGAKDAVTEKWNSIKSKTTEAWENVKSTIGSKAEDMKNLAQEKLNNIKSAYEEHGGGLPGIMAAGLQAVKETMSAKFDIINTLTGGKLTTLKNKFTKLANKAIQWGKDLIQNFIDGITAKFGALKKKVSSVASTVKSYLGFSEPEEGPLSNFHTYAPDMMKLYATGIEDNLYRVEQAASRVASAVGTTMESNQYVNDVGGVSINVYAAEGQDVNAIAEMVEDRINRNVMLSARAMA